MTKILESVSSKFVWNNLLDGNVLRKKKKKNIPIWSYFDVKIPFCFFVVFSVKILNFRHFGSVEKFERENENDARTQENATDENK